MLKFFMVIMLVFPMLSPVIAFSQQEPGKPLYLPPKEYPSDLAPESDPDWQEKKKSYQQRGEDPRDKPVESHYEQTIRYRELKKEKPRSRHRR